MADSTHTLHLVAKLDTSDVQAKISQLNSSASRASLPGGSSPAAGSRAGTAAAMLSLGGIGFSSAQAAQLRSMQNQLGVVSKALSSSLKQMTSSLAQNASMAMRQVQQMSSAMSMQTKMMQKQLLSMASAAQQSQAEIAMLRVRGERSGTTQRVMRFLGPPGSPEEAQLQADLKPLDRHSQAQAAFWTWTSSGGRVTKNGYGPLLNFTAQPGGFQNAQYMQSPSMSLLQGGRGSAGMPTVPVLFPQSRPQPQQLKLTGEKMRTIAGLAAAYSLEPAGDLLEAHGYKKASALLGMGSRIGLATAAGAGIGSTIAPGAGTAIGAGIGALTGSLRELIQAFTAMKQSSDGAAEALKRVSESAKAAARADKAAVVGMLAGLREERLLGSFSSMTRGEASAAQDLARKNLAQVEAQIASGDYAGSAHLSELLAERSKYQSRIGAAGSQLESLQQAAAAKRAQEEAKMAALRATQAQLEALHGSAGESLLGMSQAALSRGNALKLAGMQANGSVDLAWLRTGWKKHGAAAQQARESALYHLSMAGMADSPALAQEMLNEASRQQSRSSFSLSQADFFKSSLLSELQGMLSRLTSPDMSHVTSLGQYGYGMGEKNDNIERQMKVWEEQAQLQRDIRDILSDRTFEAAYAD